MEELHINIKEISCQYGARAFQDGKKRVPAHDEEFLNSVIAGLKVGEGLPFIKEWLKGWDNENLKDHEI